MGVGGRRDWRFKWSGKMKCWHTSFPLKSIFTMLYPRAHTCAHAHTQSKNSSFFSSCTKSNLFWMTLWPSKGWLHSIPSVYNISLTQHSSSLCSHEIFASSPSSLPFSQVLFRYYSRQPSKQAYEILLLSLHNWGNGTLKTFIRNLPKVAQLGRCTAGT